MNDNKTHKVSSHKLWNLLLVTIVIVHTLMQGPTSLASDTSAQPTNEFSSINFTGNASWLRVSVDSDGSLIAAITREGGLYLSSDYGNSWRGIFLGVYAGLGDVSVSPDGRTVTAWSGHYVLQSIDSGANWNTQYSIEQHRTCNYLVDCGITPNALGLVGHNGPSGATSVVFSEHTLIVASQANSYTWQAGLYLSSNWNWVSQGQSADGSKIFATAWQWTKPGPAISFYVSTDWGKTFSLVSSSGMFGSLSSDGSTLVSASDTGVIAVSRDMGATWNSSNSPDASQTKIKASADGSKMFAIKAGTQTRILESDNSGWTWQALNIPGAKSYVDVFCNLNCTSIYVLTNQDSLALSLFKSEDSGKSWSRLPNLPNIFDSSPQLAISHDGERLVASTYRNIYSSQDGGISWSSADIVTQGCNFAPFLAEDDQSVLLLDCLGEAYRSQDGGLHWAATGFPANRINDVAYSAKLLVASSEKAIYTSADLGISWKSSLFSPEDVPGASYVRFDAVSVSADGKVLLANKTGPIVIISKDGGSTWSELVDFKLDKTDRTGADAHGTYNLWLNRDGSQSVICRQPGICWMYSARPKLLGSGAVGTLLAADVGVWDSEVKLSYQWLRDGVAIDQAKNSSYLVAPADLGSKISVSVTGSRVGFAQVGRVSSVIGTTEGVMSLTPVPRVLGSGVVGTLLAADVGVWDSEVKLSYQWFRGSDPIFQERRLTHVVSREDAGKSLSVQVSVAKPGYKSVTIRSELISAKFITFTNPTQPKLVGVPKVGSSLKVITANWGGATSISYKWLLDGKTLIGQNGSTLRILSKFKGHAIGAIVTQTCNACQTVSLSSTKLPIRR